MSSWIHRSLACASIACVLLLAGAARADEPEAQPAPAPAPAPASEADVAQLREALAAQKREHAALEERVAAQERSKRELTLSGYVHADWVLFRQSSQSEVSPGTGEPLNEDRLLIRRARIRLASDQGIVHGAVEIDANTIHGPQVRPWNAEASIKWPASTPYRGPATVAQQTAEEPFIIVSAGLLMTPFGFDVPELESQRAFLERTTMANELVPQSFDLGVRALGGYKFVNYALGIMNGAPIGERSFPGRDPNKSKDLVFRLGSSAELLEGVRLDVGFSGLTGRGFSEGDPPSKDQLVWRDENEDGIVQQTELRVNPGGPASPSRGFQRFALGADARLHITVPVIGELQLRAELVRAKNLDRGMFAADPVRQSRDLRELGWYVAGTQEITRWVMVGVRYDLYDPDADAQEQLAFARVPRDTARSTWAFMAMARWKKARLVAEYDKRKNAFGRDATGAPTTLADDSFTLRAVVGF